jgi:methyl-accepting chemotaxis protein
MDVADRSVVRLRALVAANDRDGLDRYVIDELYKDIDPVTEKIGELVDLQLRVAGEEFERAERVFTVSQWLQIGLIAMGLLVIAGGALAMIAGVTRPVGAMTDAMTRIARHDLDVVIPAARRDEIGAMAAALEIFRENLSVADRLEADRRHSQERREKRQQEVERLIAGFDDSASGAIASLASAAQGMQRTAQSMAATAEETLRQATAVAAASEQASANVQSVAGAAGQLAGSISEIGRQVSESAQIARDGAGEAARANVQVQELTAAVQKIGDVVKLINDIAGQTNLLALNATIEAARAGEAGKGFAVVASEVKSLATQTAKATEDIAQQVQGVQNATGAAVTAIENIGRIIERVSGISSSIAAAVEQQGIATREIARNVDDASKGTKDVASNITGVTVAAKDTGEASARMLDSAADLGRQGDALRAEIDRFFAAIRAA